MHHTICYVSKAVPGLSDAQVDDIFNQTLLHNNRHGITGILIYGFGNFFQVIEGEKRPILRLFSTIKKDPRHQSVEVLINNRVKNPVFGGYKTTFNIVKTRRQLSEISRYLNVYEYNRIFSDRMKRLIHPFLLSL